MQVLFWLDRTGIVLLTTKNPGAKYGPNCTYDHDKHHTRPVVTVSTTERDCHSLS